MREKMTVYQRLLGYLRPYSSSTHPGLRIHVCRHFDEPIHPPNNQKCY